MSGRSLGFVSTGLLVVHVLELNGITADLE